MKVYAFDVDLTLEFSRWELKEEHGHILGLCGNWARVTLEYRPWPLLFSFVGPLGTSKAEFLHQIMLYVPAEEHVMVGNDTQVGHSPNDALAAKEARWRFIKESDFAAGAR